MPLDGPQALVGVTVCRSVIKPEDTIQFRCLDATFLIQQRVARWNNVTRKDHHLVVAALGRHQPVLVRFPLLAVRHPPVGGHLGVGGELLPAVGAGGGATARLIVHNHVLP